MSKKIGFEEKKHKDITRINQESKRTYGWYVRVRFFGKTYYKFFSDKKNGGKEKALIFALIWRDKKEEELGKPRSDRHIVTVSNINSGVVGVRLNKRLKRYEVSWVNPDSTQGKTSVSIAKHGKEKAFERACEIRKEKEAIRLAD